jgi:hypothetical protein
MVTVVAFVEDQLARGESSLEVPTDLELSRFTAFQTSALRPASARGPGG